MKLLKVKKIWIRCLGVTISMCVGTLAFAHHPNEGSVTITALLESALKNNIELKESSRQLEVATAQEKKTLSPFLPQVSIDGGYQSDKFNEEKSSGSVLHATGNWNLYRGGKDQAARDTQSQDEVFQQFKARKAKLKVEREVFKKYYELLYLEEGSALKEEALVANKRQNELALKKKNSGFSSQADVLEFELREATLRSDISLLVQEESTLERELSRLVGWTEEVPMRVSGHLERMHFSRPSKDLLDIALSEREDLKEAEKNRSVSQLEYRSYFADYLPKIDLEGQYGKLATEDRVFNQFGNYSVALKLSLPIFSGLDTVYGRQVKSFEIEKNDLSASRLRQEIRVQVENAILKLKSLSERLDLEEKNQDRSKQYYEITLSEYKRGVKNSPDVAGAAEKFFDSRLRNLEYRKEYYLTLVHLAETVGVSMGEIVR